MSKADLLVIPIVIVEAILLRAILLLVGIQNSVVFLACLFLIYHISFTGLLYMQVRNLIDSYVTRLEVSMYSALLVSSVAIITYAAIGLFPILKVPFFLLRYLPYSNIWLDLFIVATPTYFAHVVSRMVSTGLLL